MESGRMLDSAGQAWRRQAHGDHARGGERPDVYPMLTLDGKTVWRCDLNY